MSTIFLMRHSMAVPADFQTTDISRWLTAQGRELATLAGVQLARELASSGRVLDCIVSSPLVRAVQTAELVAAALGHVGEIRSMHALRSESSSQRGVDDLRALGHACVLAVTHEPIVSTMTGLLTNADVGGFGAGYRPSEVRGFEDEYAFWRHQP